MKFRVQQDVLDIGVKIIFATIEGMHNTVSEKWMAQRDETLQQFLLKYRDIDIHSDPVLEGFHILHDHSGVKRRKNIPASENLIRLLNKNQGLCFINQAVDIYNLISLESKLALGAHNMDHVNGNITLRFTDGSEHFLPIGQTEPSPVAAHEYCYCDDSNEVLCRLEIRQVEKTKVDESATNVFYIIQGNAATSQEFLLQTAQRIIDTTSAYCGGMGKIILPEII